MKKGLFVFMMCFFFSSTSIAGGGLDTFLDNLNIRADADLGGFCASVSAQFGVPEARVRVVLNDVRHPGDAFMVFQLGQFSRQPTDRVMAVYRNQKDKGWGVIAKELGIKPGSSEFHALKQGEFNFDFKPSKDSGKEKGNGKGKGKSKKR